MLEEMSSPREGEKEGGNHGHGWVHHATTNTNTNTNRPVSLIPVTVVASFVAATTGKDGNSRGDTISSKARTKQRLFIGSIFAGPVVIVDPVAKGVADVPAVPLFVIQIQ